MAHGPQYNNNAHARQDPDFRNQIRGFTGIGSPAPAPGPDMALSALKGLALNTNQGAGSIGPVAEAFGLKAQAGTR